MNTLAAILATASLCLIASGCASYPSAYPDTHPDPAPYPYPIPYPRHPDPNPNSGYYDPGHGSHSHAKHDDDKPRQPTLKEKQVKALEDAAKKGADPASTLYQQILLRQMH
jgi:hypothetical protein